MLKFPYVHGTKPPVNNEFNIKLNNSLIVFDSTAQTTRKFRFDDSGIIDSIYIISKNVTDKVNYVGNTIIWPNQANMISGLSFTPYVYSSFFLVIIYEDSNMSKISTSVFITDVNQGGNINLNCIYSDINPIYNNNDVACAIMNNASCDGGIISQFQTTLIANSTSFSLGTISPTVNCQNTMQASFIYQNDTLTGLRDDTDDNVVNNTDALVNLKTYLPNLSSNFNIMQQQSMGDRPIWQSTIFAYTTPCPSRGFHDTIVKHTICQGQSITLNTQSIGNNYAWYPITSLNNTTTANPIATPTTTTNYIVSIDSAGCKHTEHVQVAVTPTPKADTIIVNNNICGGPSGSIIVKPSHGPYEPYTYSLNSAASVNDTSFLNLSGGIYNLLVTDARGCTWQSNTFVIKDTLLANALAYASPINGIAPFTTLLSATASTGATVYDWYINNQFVNSAWYYNQTFTNSGTYNITLIAYNNITTCADTTTFTITVLPQDTAGIFIPNVFSPNGDGVNDMFEVRIKNAEFELFEIYDRWGVAIIKNEELKINSDGIISWTGRTTSGIECSSGTYFYVVKIKLDEKYSKEGIKEYKGFITLLK